LFLLFRTSFLHLLFLTTSPLTSGRPALYGEALTSPSNRRFSAYLRVTPSPPSLRHLPFVNSSPTTTDSTRLPWRPVLNGRLNTTPTSSSPFCSLPIFIIIRSCCLSLPPVTRPTLPIKRTAPYFPPGLAAKIESTSTSRTGARRTRYQLVTFVRLSQKKAA